MGILRIISHTCGMKMFEIRPIECEITRIKRRNYMLQKGLLTAGIIGIMAFFSSPAYAEPPVKDLSLSGAYLGLVNIFEVDSQAAGDPDHQQFDFAVNVDFDLKLRENVEITFEIQGGTGGGSLGLAGPEGVFTDLTLEFYHSRPGLDMEIEIGSFDTPFGEETEFLTNNANTFGNAFFLNDLFYSAFGGTVGTLNTLGVMGIFETKPVDVTLSITNGGDEGASNTGGDFQYVARVETSAIPGIARFGGSYMAGDDSFDSLSTAPNQADGFKSDFSGWMVDGKIEPLPGFALKAYLGEVSYGDNLAATKDDVGIWMGEASYGKGPWKIAVRFSGWEPDDDNGDGAGMSAAIPNPGLTGGWDEVTQNTDQKMLRLQVGGTWNLYENLVGKLEYVRDDTDKPTLGRSTDMDGWMLLLNGSF